MVGGGGSGGRDIGAGGGGGAVLYGQDCFIPAGSYTLFVGRGAVSTSGETVGQTTSGFGSTILGGGSAGDATWAGAVYAGNGGGNSGGGKGVLEGGSRTPGKVGVSVIGALLYKAVLYNGNLGGYAVSQTSYQVVSSGGGGAGAVGGNGQQSSGSGGTAVASSGGAGVSNTILDTTYYWGGGGGGGSYAYTTPANGGIGGGGAGNNNNGGGITATGSNGANSFFAVGTAINGINGTGGGGGGGGYTTASAGSGGAGVIIIRYKRPVEATRVIDYFKGGTGNPLEYKTGMVGGDYRIQGVSTATYPVNDRLVIEGTTGNVVIGQPSASVVIKSLGDVIIDRNATATNITALGTITSAGVITSGNNIYVGGVLSGTGVGYMVYQSQNFATNWMFETTNYIAYSQGNAQLNIHNLVVWDTDTGSSWFGIIGITASYAQTILLLAQSYQNKGVILTYNFNYNNSGNSYIWFSGAGSNNTLRYRFT
jgi:hypothetical protein